MRRNVLAASLTAVAITAGVALAVVNDFQATGAEATVAARVALDAVGGEWATPVVPAEPAEAWNFRVVHQDGTLQDVALDRDLHVIRVGDMQAAPAASSGATYYLPLQGPVAMARELPAAAPEPPSAPARFLAQWSPVSQADAQRAADAALEAVGGGTVHDVDREDEGGSTWEVELTAPDGRALEVHLDARFNVIRQGGERDANESYDDAEDRDEGPDDD